MSTNRPDDGGSAFPRIRHDPTVHGAIYHEGGMTLRDYFAAKAMAALLTVPEFMDGASQHRPHLGARDAIAATAYDIADSMLKARSSPAAGAPESR